MRIILAIYLAIGLFAGNVYSGNEVKQRSLFTDVKAHKVGDLVTVLIVEESQASNRAKTSTQKKSDAKTTGTAGLGPLDFIPAWDFSGSDQMQFDGQGQTEKTGLIRAKLTASVTEIRDNGDLVIEGNRNVTINNEQETLFLNGVVRSRDISQDNTIYSYQIGDARISTKSKGAITDGQRPGFVTRLLNWIF
jgi:flagellar L-ring protein precursor FlgH